MLELTLQAQHLQTLIKAGDCLHLEEEEEEDVKPIVIMMSKLLHLSRSMQLRQKSQTCGCIHLCILIQW